MILHKSYVVLFPSIYPEAFGISGIEAMMRAKPVVAFNVGGVSTWLEHNKTGILVQSLNQMNTLQLLRKLLIVKLNTKAYH